MAKVDRKLFVPEKEAKNAERDWAVPIPKKQTTSAPHMIMMMLAAAAIKEGDTILEIGTGSGYNTALLSLLAGDAGQVHSIERIPELLEFAKKNLDKVDHPNNITLNLGDGTIGLPGMTFDKILVTAAAPYVPHALCEQLRVSGILLIPVEDRWYQSLLRITRLEDSKQDNKDAFSSYFKENQDYPHLYVEYMTSVRFVKLIGENGFREG